MQGSFFYQRTHKGELQQQKSKDTITKAFIDAGITPERSLETICGVVLLPILCETQLASRPPRARTRVRAPNASALHALTPLALA